MRFRHASWWKCLFGWSKMVISWKKSKMSNFLCSMLQKIKLLLILSWKCNSFYTHKTQDITVYLALDCIIMMTVQNVLARKHCLILPNVTLILIPKPCQRTHSQKICTLGNLFGVHQQSRIRWLEIISARLERERKRCLHTQRLTPPLHALASIIFKGV
jgi:hypothetical protein